MLYPVLRYRISCKADTGFILSSCAGAALAAAFYHRCVRHGLLHFSVRCAFGGMHYNCKSAQGSQMLVYLRASVARSGRSRTGTYLNY